MSQNHEKNISGVKELSRKQQDAISDPGLDPGSLKNKLERIGEI